MNFKNVLLILLLISILACEKEVSTTYKIFDFTEMIFVQGGTFYMGCNAGQENFCFSDEEPSHKVNLSDFYISKYELTQAQWFNIIDTIPSQFKGCDSCPIDNVSWNDVQLFLKKLNAKYPDVNYRLPTEAEWEYAARGGIKTQNLMSQHKYAGSDTIDIIAWYRDNTDRSPLPVGQKAANELGLFDMSGNIWEWCNDWYNNRYYKIGEVNNPLGPSSGTHHVLRGGNWKLNSSYCRISNRGYALPDEKTNYYGFRLACSIPLY